MDPNPSKLQHREQQESATQSQASQQHQQQAREFESVEELLRYDAAQTEPPPTLESRVADSVAREPAQSRSWWKRLFGYTNP
jgi:transposase